MSNEVNNLKACPFCGSAPYLAEWKKGPPDGLQMNVRQVRCDCGVSGPERWGTQDAMDAWNRREIDMKKDRGKAVAGSTAWPELSLFTLYELTRDDE